jgi:pectate lyase-like protein
MSRFFLTSTRKIIPGLCSCLIAVFAVAVPLIASLAAALAQSPVTRIGPITPGDCASFSSPNSIQDGGIPCGAGHFANPTGAVGLAVVPGVATTAMRSDAAPPLSASVQSALTGANGQILIGTGGFGFASIVLGGDCTFTSPNIICTKTNGVAFGTFATANAATPPAIGGTTPAAGAFSSLTDSGISGSTQCVQANSSGLFSGSGGPCGASLLGSNNTWTGTNTFADTYFSGRPWFDALSSAHSCVAADPTGVSDATTSIQCHATYMFSTFSAGPVFLPCGTYLISGGATGLLLKGGVSLIGESLGCVNLQVATDSNVVTFDSATCNRGAGISNIFVVGFQNVAATKDAVIVGANCNPILRDDYIWFGANAINTAGVDAIIENVFACGYTNAVTSTGANWYIRDKLDTCGITSTNAFTQGATSFIAENHFTDTDFSGTYTRSVNINDITGTHALTVFHGGVFSSNILEQNGLWTSFIGAEFGSTTLAVNNNTSIVGSLALSATTVSGSGTRSCAGNFSITC